MLLSIFALLVALVVGVAFHCSSSLRDRYCLNYYNPLQARVLQAANHTQQQAAQVYLSVSKSSLLCYQAASERLAGWYGAGRQLALSVYASAAEMLVEGEEESKGSGGGGGSEKARKT